MAEYNDAITEYNSEREKIVQKEIETLKANNLPKLEEEAISCQDKLEEFKKKISDGTAAEVTLMENEDYRKPRLRVLFLKNEIEEAKKELVEQYKVKQQLLDLKIIYPKYNDIVAWTTIYEYYQTGRCNALSGPDGAYNLYESETRANIIISQLDKIIDQLDAIKKNQFVLYQVLVSIDEGIKNLNEKMDVAIGELALLHIDNLVQDALLAAIAGNTACTAYNTAKAAKYSEIQADRGEAIIFLGRR